MWPRLTTGPAGSWIGKRVQAGYDAGALLPASVNVAGGYAFGPSIDASDRFVLYFSGMRPEASAGKLDLYRVHYTIDHRTP
jgi:hypothetical protein